MKKVIFILGFLSLFFVCWSFASNLIVTGPKKLEDGVYIYTVTDESKECLVTVGYLKNGWGGGKTVSVSCIPNSSKQKEE